MITETEKHVIFPWRDAYSVGMPEIDNQHKGLIRLINELQSAMMEGNGKNVLAGIMDDLVRYTESHFAFEEAMMRKRGYSQLAAHSAEHKRLTGQVCELRDKFRGGKVTISMEVMKFLKDWLADHILNRDQAYAKELNGR
ncbi:Hemerythrin-like metal-binding protein [Candidatus Sulfopaludibacter sp. SbA4]|nr:Hemerythrin-like metal-binding protein [Candidatus Sulfopaludibacter sp. SbA4]